MLKLSSNSLQCAKHGSRCITLPARPLAKVSSLHRGAARVSHYKSSENVRGVQGGHEQHLDSVAELGLSHATPFTASSSVASAASASEASTDSWVPVCLPEELPKGVRKEVEVDGRQVLLFWYRNQIYAIEGRSPTEGAYSEGFITAKFTQDYSIECPSTGTLYSIKDGSIVSWYPNNPVLRALTPRDTGRRMDVYPVKLTQQAISVDVSRSTAVATRQDRGGAGTSLENNNVFTVQPNVYFEGMDPSKEQASVYQEGPKGAAVNPAVAATTVLAFGALAVAGTAVCAYLLFTN